MDHLLDRNLYFVREHVGMFKAANNFDILDPESGEEILHCREPNLGGITKVLRFTDYKRMTPFDVRVTTPSGEPVLQVTRGISIFLSKVQVHDSSGQALGGFQQKLFSIGGKFELEDPAGKQLCTLAGKWTGWEFQFKRGDKQLARVSKSWSGLGKELFTTADNYILEISDKVPKGAAIRKLILASVLCIDMVLKE
ncbi:MAG: hypothetical protein ACI8TQ_000645 [Planctomycetota bacterium]|jgi:uncharacterized protein YxjI